jgi:probable O-glycosylation ligase (exosortase A-associated)
MVYWGLLLFFVLEYARPGNFIPGINAIRLNSLVPLAITLGTLFGTGPVKSSEVMEETTTKVILGLLFMILASFIVADVTMSAFELFTTVLGYVFVYWVITMRVTQVDEVKGVFKVLIFVHLLLAAMTPAMFTDPDTRHYINGGTFLGDGNDYALSVNLCIPFALFLMFAAEKKGQKLMAIGALFVLIICVVATQSRGGTIALGFTGFYYWLKSNKKAVTASLAAVGVVTVLIFAPPAYFNRMNTISNYEEDGSAQGRITAWWAGTGMAMSNPILGVGAGNFPANYTKFAPAGPEGPETRWKTAHSIYFLILGELGLPGLGLLIGFIVVNLRQNGKLLRELRTRSGGEETTEARLLACLSASVLAYAIAGAFLSATYYPHMFVLAGLCVSARRLARASLQGERSGVPQLATKPKMIFHPAMQRALTGRRAS